MKRLFTIMLSAILCVIALAGCKMSVATNGNYNTINKDQFWIGLSDKGFTAAYDLTDTYDQAHASEDLSYLDEHAYYFDNTIEFIFLNAHESNQAAAAYAKIKDEISSLCNSKKSESSGDIAKFFGSNTSSDLAFTIYRVKNVIIIATGKVSDADQLTSNLEYLFTTDFSGRTLGVNETDSAPSVEETVAPSFEETDAPTEEETDELTNGQTEESTTLSDDVYYFMMNDGTPITFQPSDNFNFHMEDDYTKLSFTSNQYVAEVSYSDSGVALEKTVEDTQVVCDFLLSKVDRAVDTIPACKINGNVCYYLTGDSEIVQEVYLLQDVGLGNYVYVYICDYEYMSISDLLSLYALSLTF